MNHINNNPFPFSNTNKRYYTWDYYLKQRFGSKVAKVSLNAGFSCPHIKGKTGGCTFCSIHGSGDFAGNPSDEIIQQFHEIKQMMLKKWPHTTKFIGYFQAWTNTFAPVRVLKEKFEPILEQDGVIGLAIATRPDCLPSSVIDYLADLNQRTELWVELGLQTIHDRTSQRINRGHNFQTFVDGVQKLRKHNINICVHIINGLPGEDEEMMLETARVLSQMDIQAIKIHLLHVMKETPMATELARNEFSMISRDDYINITARQLELFPQHFIIQRLTGDAPRDMLIAPEWSLKKTTITNDIDKWFTLHQSFQGKHFTHSKLNQ